MLKKLLFVFLFLAFGGVTVFVGFKLLPQVVNYSGLQVIGNGSEADIYLNNQKIGRTPFEDDKQHPGEYILRLTPVNRKMKSWTRKIVLTAGAMTTVERYFSTDEKKTGGLIVYLKGIDDKMSQIEIITDPDEATVYLNKENKGKTPVTVYDVPVGNQEIIVKKTGYEDRIHKIDTVSGFKVSFLLDLIPEKQVKGIAAAYDSTDSAKIITPTPMAKSTINKNDDKIIEVIETGTGWLRVRENPSAEASESAKVEQGNQFINLDEKNGWIKIEYEKGKFGWVSGEYVKKI